MPAYNHSIPHQLQDEDSIRIWMMAKQGVYTFVWLLDSSA